MTIIALLWRLVGWRGVLVAAIIAAGAWWYFSAVSEAYKRGQTIERQVWEEQRRKDLAAAEEKRIAAQQQIDAIESEYWQRDAESKIKITDLEKAIAEDISPVGGACPPAVSKRVSGAINAIGR